MNYGKENKIWKSMYNSLKSVKMKFFTKHYKKIYSQDGEDIILENFLHNKKGGFYVDIGAHHPLRFSNTYLFYKKGWSGINIDALPGSMKLFKSKRKRDINLELGISEKDRIMTYYMFNEPALNSFCERLSMERAKGGEYKIIGKKEVLTLPLDKVLDKYMSRNTKIDFMSIDVEGMDLEVLESNNWKKYKPEYLLVECREVDLEQMIDDPIYIFLKNKGYKLIAKTYRTSIFKKINNE